MKVVFLNLYGTILKPYNVNVKLYHFFKKIHLKDTYLNFCIKNYLKSINKSFVNIPMVKRLKKLQEKTNCVFVLNIPLEYDLLSEFYVKNNSYEKISDIFMSFSETQKDIIYQLNVNGIKISDVVKDSRDRITSINNWLARNEKNVDSFVIIDSVKIYPFYSIENSSEVLTRNNHEYIGFTKEKLKEAIDILNR